MLTRSQKPVLKLPAIAPEDADLPLSPPDLIPFLCKTDHVSAQLLGQFRHAPDVIAAEHVSLMVVDLPLRKGAQRLAAAGFAIEPKLADTLDHIHVAVGPNLGGSNYLVAAINHEVMRSCTADHVLAEQMILPVPKDPDAWNVERVAARVLIRCGDGTGFAVAIDQFKAVWELGRNSDLHSFGAALPQGIPCQDCAGERPKLAERDLKFNLRQGAYSRRTRSVRRLLAACAAMAVVSIGVLYAALVGHVQGIERQNETQRAAIEARLADVAPGLPITAAGLAALSRLAMPQAAQAPDPFLGLFADVSAGLLSAPPDVAVQSFTYQSAAGTMGLDLAASSLEALRDTAQILQDHGLIVETGAISRSEDGARSTVTLRKGDS